MSFDYVVRKEFLPNPPNQCCTHKVWYEITYNGNKCPLSCLEFDSEKEVEAVIYWLNKLIIKKRFELRIINGVGVTDYFQIWDNLDKKQVPFAPIHMKTTNPRITYEKYVDFLNELYEENPLNE